MKRIRTVHPRTIVGSTLYEFTPVDGTGFYEGDVPDDVYEIFMKAKKHPTEWVLIPAIEPESEPEEEPEKKEKKAKK